MTITLNSTAGDFLAAFTRAALVTEKRSSIASLRMVRLRAGLGDAMLEATNLEQSVEVVLRGTAGGAGRCLLDPAALTPMLRAVPPEAPVFITAHGEHCEHVSASIGVMSWRADMTWAGECKPLPSADGAIAAFHVQAVDLLAIVNRAWHAISTEETRYYLNGIYLHRAGDALRGIATDGHRMMWHDILAPEGTPDNFGVIVPTDAWAALRELLAGRAGGVKVIIGPQAAARLQVVEFCTDEWALATKTIDGTYPDYQSAVPKRGDAFATVSVRSPAAFAAYVMALIGGGDRADPVALRPGFSGNVNVYAGAANDRGRRFAALPENSGASDPTFIEGAAHDTAGVIMPMRIDGLVQGV